MSYYAIAVGRETKITQSYLECKELTHGYSGAKYKKFHTLEDAENYIQKHQENLEKRKSSQFEESPKLVPSFLNNSRSTKSVKTEYYISFGSEPLTVEAQNPLTGEIQVSNYNVELQIKSLISTLGDLPLLELDLPYLNYGDSRLRNFFDSLVIREITDDKMVYVLNYFAKQLEFLYRNGINNLNIFTDSHYIVHVVTRDVFAMRYTYDMSDLLREAYENLYSIMSLYDNIFISHFNGKLAPMKLQYVQNPLTEVTE